MLNSVIASDKAESVFRHFIVSALTVLVCLHILRSRFFVFMNVTILSNTV